MRLPAIIVAAAVLLIAPSTASAVGEPSGSCRVGAVLGSITVERLGVHAQLICGEETRELNRGPSLASYASMPGSGKTTLIAAHRTTYGAWFRHIDELKEGDLVVVTIRQRFGLRTFHYRVTGWRIIGEDDLRKWIKDSDKDFGPERLILSACNPLHSHAQRYWVYAYPVRKRGIPRAPGLATKVAGLGQT